VETTSRPFQILHSYDPMAYGVNGLRQLILGGIDEELSIPVDPAFRS
jgi:putative membrane protein